jgi:hypothetical protein
MLQGLFSGLDIAQTNIGATATAHGRTMFLWFYPRKPARQRFTQGIQVFLTLFESLQIHDYNK